VIRYYFSNGAGSETEWQVITNNRVQGKLKRTHPKSEILNPKHETNYRIEEFNNSEIAKHLNFIEE